MLLFKIKSALIHFIQSYLTILIILALGLFTYWQTLYLNKNQKLLNSTDISKFHTPIYQLENAEFKQYQQLDDAPNTSHASNTHSNAAYSVNQYTIQAKKALQYADDQNFELQQAHFNKKFSPSAKQEKDGLKKSSALTISSQQALLDSNFNQLQLKENVHLKRQDAAASLELKANNAVVELRRDIVSLQKVQAHYQNLKTQAQHRFNAENTIWDEQNQKLEAQNIKIYFENPQSASQ